MFGFTVQLQDTQNEYNLKAAFVYNFTKYIEWEKNKPELEFVIGVYGSSPIHKPLSEIAKSKTVLNKKITIKQYTSPQEINSCQLLFISQSASTPLNEILASAHEGMLIVSEKNGYANAGTALNFVIVEDKIKFEANVKVINSAGLKASSQLLKLAIVVD